MIVGLAATALIVALAAWSAVAVRETQKRWPPIGSFVAIDGVRLHVTDEGTGPPVLLIHGASSNLREMIGPLAPVLGADHRLLALDRPGAGYSARPAHAEQLAVQARLIADLLVARHAAPAIVVAHSYGAAVALRLALDRPDLVRGLVLVAPASHPYPGGNPWWARIAAIPVVGWLFAHLAVPVFGPPLAHRAAAAVFKPAQPPAHYYQDEGVGLALLPGAFIANGLDVTASNREFAAQAPRYRDLETPVIIITAARDPVVSVRLHARALAAEIPGAELVIAPDAGHMPHVLRPDLVNNAVRRIETIKGAMAGVATGG